MTFCSHAFVSPVALTGRLSPSSFVSSRVAPAHVAATLAKPGSRAASAPRMQQTADATRKEKKRAAPNFSTDIKGNIVWTLRSGKPEDTAGVHELVKDVLPLEIVEALLTDSECCAICEVAVKGPKEGDSFKAEVHGVALCDVSNAVRNPEEGFESGLVKYGQLLTVAIDPELPDETALKKLLLGSMKKMKEAGVLKVVHSTTKPERVELLEECLFKAKGKDDLDLPLYECNLVAENPDPLKKMM